MYPWDMYRGRKPSLESEPKVSPRRDLNRAKSKIRALYNIFESTLRAKRRFPDVLDVSAAQNAEISASEEEAPTTVADAIRAASRVRQEEVLL